MIGMIGSESQLGRLVNFMGVVRTHTVPQEFFKSFDSNAEYTVVEWEHNKYIIDKCDEAHMLTIGGDPCSYMVTDGRGNCLFYVDFAQNLRAWKTVEDAINLK